MKINKNVQFALLLVAILLLSGCAVSYRTIRPESLKYPSAVNVDGMQVSYKYDVLRSSGNKRYAKKEYNKGLQLIAIQIKNQSDTTIRLSRDYEIYSGNDRIIPMEVGAINSRLKQKVWPYYFYLLMTFGELNYYVATPTMVTVGSLKIGYLLGPGLTLLNVTKASTANRNLFINLNATDIWDRDIQGGETVYGLIGLERRDFNPIHLRKK